MEISKKLVCILFLVFFLVTTHKSSGNTTIPIHVGVILDMGTLVGKMGRTSILMAIDDFYSTNTNYSTRLVLHTRDSNNDIVQAASAATDLLENEQVQAIIGPQKSAQAAFLSNLANKSQVPLLSFSATNPSLSAANIPYFIRTASNDSTQVRGPLFSIIKAFGWKEVVPIYEDTDYGRDIIPYLVDALEGIGARLPYRSVISPSLSDDQIKEELYKLITMETRVFIVHTSSLVGARLFSNAKQVGIIRQGYVWIMTDGLTNIIDSLDSSVIDSIQGFLGVKLYIPASKELQGYNIKWRRRFQKEYPDDQPTEPSIFGLWAYDTVWALAMAAEKLVGFGNVNSSSQILPNNVSNNSLSFKNLEVSVNGQQLLETILNTKFRGLSGQFHLIDGQLQASTFQIINFVGKGGRGIGFWTPKHGISKELNPSNKNTYSTSMTDLSSPIWPGDSIEVPKGWENPVSGRKLRIGVPVMDGFQEFVSVQKDHLTNTTTVTGYSIDVFEAVTKYLPYAIPHEYIPFGSNGVSAGTYNDLVYKVYLQEYDAVVGDTTIRANRSIYVDFTLPYTESGVSMIVPVKETVKTNAWIFLKPLTMDLWLGTLAFFVFTGFVVWVMEHRINDDFRGSVSEQLGTVFYFTFSMLVFGHREKVKNILSRIVVIIWVFVVLILTSSYTASLSSMLTVQQLLPTVTSVQELQKNGDYVGYDEGSFVLGLLKELKFDDSKIRAYGHPDDYIDALTKGSKNGGVAAIFHEIPYIKLFLAKHCTGYTMVGPVFKTAGFGFVFPKGSPLVPDISRGILNVTEGNTMTEIENKWLGDHTACLNQGNNFSSSNLTFFSFWGLFLVTGAASTCALLIFLTVFFYENWHELRLIDPDKPIWARFEAWFKFYDRKDLKSYTSKKQNAIDTSGHSSVNNRHAASMEVPLDVDELHNRSSFSHLPDANLCPREEEISSGELGSPRTEDLRMQTSVPLDVDELHNRSSFYHLPDANLCPREEEISSGELGSPRTEAPLVTTVMTN